jgi:hypothetical protein
LRPGWKVAGEERGCQDKGQHEITSKS